ncbi:MAG: hypothetical protein H6613_04215 [Ignavibacteriales bacterium]|nr:hypothetical protein [Ignavibacteriales bacterium]
MQNKKVFIFASVIASTIILLNIYPIIITKFDNSLGFVTYSKNWTNNESVFQLINILVKQIIYNFKIDYQNSLRVTRWVVFFIFSVLIIFQVSRKEKSDSDLLKKLYYLVAIMYLISPTQFPWYYTWVLPLLVLSPRLSFTAYAILLPLYQLKYFWDYLVWIEHIPIIILFIIEMAYPKFADYLQEKIN